MSQQQQPNIQELLALIQAQSAQMQQMQNMQMQANAAQAAEAQRRADVSRDAAAVRANGGIYGYAGNRALSQEEKQFHILVMGLGTNIDTADEIFRQGLCGTDVLKSLTSEKLKNIIYNINKNRSPDCPDPKKIFIDAVFEDKVSTLIEWIKFQRIVGGAWTAVAWNSHTDAMKDTKERIQYYQEIKDSEGTEDIPLPEPLTDMKKFMDFSDHMQTYLRIKRGAANVPLIYVVRENKTVTAAERSGTIGNGVGDMYKNWDEYAITCTVMNGTHWESDNASFWQVLSSLVRDGPGWDYIRRFEKDGDGDGRGAYLALVQQAYQYSNVRLIKEQARENLRGLRYDGPSRNWSYDKYVRHWLRNIRVLRKFNDCPNEDHLVSDFCRNISDPRLDNAISLVLQEGSNYLNSFDRTQKYFTTVLGIANSRKNQPKRNLSSTSTTTGTAKSSNKTKFSGQLIGKHYSPSEWHSMTNDQKNKVRELRQKEAKKRSIAAVSTESDNDKPEESKKDAGNQFGSAAHKGKKRKTSADNKQ